MYYRLAHKVLLSAGFKVCVSNHYHVRCFAKGLGQLTKTDKIDAQILCIYGEKEEPNETAYPDPQQEELQNLVLFKKQLEEEFVRYKSYKEANFVSSLVQSTLETRGDLLKKNIKKIQQQIDDLIETNIELSAKKNT